MKIAIKNPAPLGGSLTRWGDYHFGMSLQHALEGRGASVVQHFWPEWHREDEEDMVLVLRGKRRFRPAPGKRAAMWIISHPATISPEELNEYDIVFSASETLARMIGEAVDTPVEVMRQCTDTRFFHPDVGSDDVDHRSGIVFVANSRGTRREILDWAVETGMLPRLIGTQWSQLGLGGLVEREYVENADLPDLYRSARVALNDHWGDMRHFGIISNRIFDCLACGLPLVSDGFPELVDVCGEGVHVAHDARSFWDAIWKHRTRYAEMQAGAARKWEEIGRYYSFDARADQIIAQAGNPPRRGRATASPAAGRSSVVTWLETLLEEVAERRSPRAKVTRVLHLCPSVEASAFLAGLGHVHSYTAGPGEGPWQLPISTSLAGQFSGEFDAVVVEREDLWSQVEDQGAVLEALSPLIAAHGVLAVRPTAQPRSAGSDYGRGDA